MSNITIIGGGNMGFALASGILASDVSHQLTIADPDLSQHEKFESLDVKTLTDNSTALVDSDIITLAVKPQIIEHVSKEIAPRINKQLIVSIAAGTPLSLLQAWLGESIPIVRCMPNTPALIGEGISGLHCNVHVTDELRRIAEQLMSVCGEVVWLNSDDEMDMVTALSGSGPAYFFAVIENLIAAGESLGLTPATAKRLVIQTAVGSAMMASQSHSDPAELRQNVTSPGGTTEAGLKELARKDMGEILSAAVARAYERAKELGGSQ